MHLFRIASLAGAALLTLTSVSSNAAVVVFNFNRVLTSSSIDGVSGTLTGQSVSGQFSYDTSLLPDSYLTSYGVQVGEVYTASTHLSFITPLGVSLGILNLIDDHSASYYSGPDQFHIGGNPSSGPFFISSLTAYIPARPLNAPLPANLTGTSFDFTLIGDTSPAGYQTVLGGNVTVGAPAAVPEPASWAMMVGGFGLIGGAARRRQMCFRFA